MKTKPLTDMLERVDAWPPHVQDELAAFAREFDANVSGHDYQPTPDELTGVCVTPKQAASPATSRSRPRSPNSAVHEP